MAGLVTPAVPAPVMAAVMAQVQLHVATASGVRCVCGHTPASGRLWATHRAEVAVAAAADWLRALPPPVTQASAGVWAANQLTPPGRG